MLFYKAAFPILFHILEIKDRYGPVLLVEIKALGIPVRYVDVDGMGWWDKVAGYGIGLITDLVPGTGSLRDKYSPNDPSDYNIALRGSAQKDLK